MPGSTESAMLQLIAQNLGVSPVDLSQLIQFESKWNPAAKNKLSSARGLLQFTNATAQRLGFADSLDLVEKNPTAVEQLPIVERYLEQYKPYSGKQSLFMAVFYPAARSWPPGQQFPDKVKKVNPGVNTPADYVRKVEGKGGEGFIIPVALLLFALYHFLNKKGFL